MEEKLAGAEESEGLEEKVKSMDGDSEGMEETSVSADEKRESMYERPEAAEEKPEAVVEGLEAAEEKPENVNEEPESMEENPESTREMPHPVEEGTASTGEAAAEKTDNGSQDDKKQGRRKKIMGIAELTAAFFLTALSAWLFINTRGTRLLYVSVATGRVSRYYWIFFAIAAIFAVLGLITLKGFRREDRRDLPGSDKEARKENDH